MLNPNDEPYIVGVHEGGHVAACLDCGVDFSPARFEWVTQSELTRLDGGINPDEITDKKTACIVYSAGLAAETLVFDCVRAGDGLGDIRNLFCKYKLSVREIWERLQNPGRILERYLAGIRALGEIVRERAPKPGYVLTIPNQELTQIIRKGS
jgi:hypothetical protein